MIFGNDPYTRLSQATGRSFEQGDLSNWVRDFETISPSLKTLLAAAAATGPVSANYPLLDRRGTYDYKKPPFGRRPLWISHLALELALRHRSLLLPSPRSIFRHWTSQGVLWINRTLIFSKWDDEHRASHEQMWAPFTERVLDVLMSQASSEHPMVFAMWGSKADDLEGPLEELRRDKRIPRSAVHYLKTGHPQWVEGYFGGSYPKFEPEKAINPLQEINRALGTNEICWLKTN